MTGPKLAPKVSIVINTLNRAGFLPDVLHGLKGLNYDNFEVVVVNGPSTDGSQAILDAFDGPLKLGTCDVANLSVSRNVGISLAAGEIVCFLDDDAVPHPTWLDHVVKPYEDPDVAAVGGFTIDNTGVRWQVRKTLCDRYGGAHNVSAFMDERLFNRPGSPFYPSLLGANSSFRASVLRDIGGFDETFAYLLDETDVCLRIVDCGLKIIYEPEALIYHQSAPSDLRTKRQVPTTLRPSSVSKAYFIMKHGARVSLTEAAVKLQGYRDGLVAANEWLANNGRITHLHKTSLNQDVISGVEAGIERARARGGQLDGDLVASEPPPFVKFAKPDALRIVMVSRGYPPATDAGIARWTMLMAQGLAAKGHAVHVITEAQGHETTESKKGVWIHRVSSAGAVTDGVTLDCHLPPSIAAWTKRVWSEVQLIKSFGLDVVSFPIWDLEGFACLDDPSIGRALSLHTSYALAKPFKPEWSARPIFEHFMVDRMIAAETVALNTAPVILANSRAIVDDITAVYDVDLGDRVMYAVHGTPDLMEPAASPPSDIVPETAEGVLKVLFAGRFEPRKGFEIALAAAAEALASSSQVEFWFAGGEPSEAVLTDKALEVMFNHPSVRFLGQVEREALDDLYRAADLVVMPSRYESFGLVAIEAMSAGTPVIGLAAGGLKEIIETGRNGYLVEDDAGAASAIAGLILSLSDNRGLLDSLSQRARADFLERFTVAAMTDAAEKAYRTAASLASRVSAEPVVVDVVSARRSRVAAPALETVDEG